jgi:mannitol-specific phosphotransferase system IIBC component
MNQVFDTSTKAGTAGGTLLTILGNINSADLLKTGILAAVGAVVSFSVTLLLKFLIKRIKK